MHIIVADKVKQNSARRSCLTAARSSLDRASQYVATQEMGDVPSARRSRLQDHCKTTIM